MNYSALYAFIGALTGAAIFPYVNIGLVMLAEFLIARSRRDEN